MFHQLNHRDLLKTEIQAIFSQIITSVALLVLSKSLKQIVAFYFKKGFLLIWIDLTQKLGQGH